MNNIAEDKILAIGRLLTDPNRPLKERFRALFALKNVNGPLAIECIGNAFNDTSALLKHELAYCLGQMNNVSAIPVLIDVLNDRQQEPIVRHEAAEALGAIGKGDVEDVLENFINDESNEVAETCRLALERLTWLRKGAKDCANKFSSIDPAPPAASENLTVEKIGQLFLDESLSMFDRYKYMFALRDLSTPESAVALTKGLKTNSPLFSHEVAFVLGQMQEEASVPGLVDCLSDSSQHEMVRHECAEALGAIATEECFQVLRKYLDDDKRVVRESCEIALDMCEYENSDEFQYAIVDV